MCLEIRFFSIPTYLLNIERFNTDSNNFNTFDIINNIN